MLGKTGGKWIYQANRQIDRQEGGHQSRMRRFGCADIKLSLVGTWAENVCEDNPE